MADDLETGKRMLDRAEVDQWMASLLERLRETFGDRLVFVGHHGSWARAEPRPGSDIDVIVIVDHLDSPDLTAFRHAIGAMPQAAALASGVFLSLAETMALRRFELVHFFYGCRTLYGTLDGIVEMPGASDLKEHIQVTASANLFHARHYLLYPHDWRIVVHRLHYPFKCCYYALQSWILLRTGRFVPTKDDLLDCLQEKDDREVVRIAKNWSELQQDRENRPLYYIELLERWSRRMLSRIEEHESSEHRGNPQTMGRRLQ